ncbi:hypothetical protein PINS_up010101 [Pythium insidiosum]|nr:hypothetical protein PINS_up010101 [Pythium insidiosum]
MASTDVNVKVAVRCRPMNSRETQLGAQSIVQVVDGRTVLIRNPLAEDNASATSTGVESPRGGADASSSSAAVKQFTFDFAYASDATQQRVYDDVARPIVDQALQGYNGTIFAYGQTGSGKTHTMMGSGDDEGIVPRMNSDLFARLADVTSDTKYLVTVSFLEIYNEVIKDLLHPSDKLLKIREHPDLGIYVEQLAELVVKEPADVSRLLAQGNKVRQVAATQMNERSSRSHSCFTLKIASKTRQSLGDGVEKETAMSAKINLVDLAGSERASKTGATGDRLKEGAAINKSLSALGNVITMLADSKRKAHVPYRDSKLTRLLQESLGGNSLTVMVAAISPADDNYDESLGTLQYANRAKAIKNATRKNEDVNERIIRELREEIERLRQLVMRPTSASASASVAGGDMMQRMEETIANLERAKHESWDEKQRLTERLEQERLQSLQNEKQILGFMQTVKQEKMDIVRRIKALQQRKLALSKQMRSRKQSYATNKARLQADVERFQTQGAALSVTEKQTLMDAIEQWKGSVINDRDELVRLKEELQACDDKLVEEEAEVAAKSALLEEDDKLRRAIQDDEREKMKHERAAFLQQALEDERRELQRKAEDEKQRLALALSETADKEKKLAEEVERQRTIALELSERLRAEQLEHAQWRTETKARLVDMVATLKGEFHSEQRALQERYDYAVELLRVAKDDILQLAARNAELEEALSKAQTPVHSTMSLTWR